MTYKAGELAPLGRQREADADKGEADNHVPGADSRNWVLGLGDVESHDPEEADEEGGNHRRSEPTRALELKRIFLRHDRRGTVIFLLLTES